MERVMEKQRQFVFVDFVIEATGLNLQHATSIITQERTSVCVLMGHE